MLRKERRQARRVAIDLEADLSPIDFNAVRSLAGPPVRARVSNVGPTGIMVDLPSEEHPGSRFRVNLNLDGVEIDFFAIVRHVTIVVTGSQPVYAHGLQITAAAEHVIDAIGSYLARRASPLRGPAKAALRASDRPGTVRGGVGRAEVSSAV